MKELIELQKQLRVGKDQSPSNNRYKYRKVDDILKAVKECNIEGIYIVLSDDLVELNGNVYTKGTATIYNSEQSVSASSFAKEGSLPGQSDPQISGSCSTYARKKALEGLLALDDGNDPDTLPSLVTPKQLTSMKNAMAELVKRNDSPAIEHLSKHLGNSSLTEIEARDIIKNLNKYLEK